MMLTLICARRYTFDFARAEVAAFYRVVKQPINAVAVVLVILRSIDSALRGNAVGASRTILETEAFHVVSELSHSRRCRRTGQARAYNDDVVLTFVRWIDQLHVESMPIPSLLDRT